MGRFAYVAWNSQGQEVKAEIDAPSSAEALTKIRSLGYFPTSISPSKGKSSFLTLSGGGESSFKGFRLGSGVKNKDLTNFTRSLSTLQDAGIPIVRSIKTLERQLKPCRLKTILGDVADSVESGSSLSEALAKYPDVFDKLFVNMVRAGEIGGVLDTILLRLADFLEKSERLRRRVIGAMIYPAVVLSVAFIILTALLIFVVPKFRDMFEKMDIPLPIVTKILLDVADLVKNYSHFGIVAVIGFVIGYKMFGKTAQGRRMIDRVKLNIPAFGDLINKAIIARFTRTLGTLIAAGVPILEAMGIVKDATGNEIVSDAVAKVRDSVREGESIAEPLRQSGICDAMVVDMIDVGEETGDLDKMLIKVADKYDEEVDTMVEGLMKAFEPILIVAMGVIIMIIVVALYYPMIHMIDQLSNKSR